MSCVCEYCGEDTPCEDIDEDSYEYMGVVICHECLHDEQGGDDPGDRDCLEDD